MNTAQSLKLRYEEFNIKIIKRIKSQKFKFEKIQMMGLVKLKLKIQWKSGCNPR